MICLALIHEPIRKKQADKKADKIKSNGLESEIKVQNDIFLYFNANNAYDLWKIINSVHNKMACKIPIYKT